MKKHLAALTATIFGALVLAGVANAALDNATAYECEDTTVVVYPGDTLWGIADSYCTGHTGNAAYDIGALNGVDTLQIGDTITLP